jgi:iron complex outermembrane receptor protein
VRRTSGTIAAILLIASAGLTAASAQERRDTIAVDTVLLLPALSVPIGRLRVGAVPTARAPFPVQTLEGSRGSAESLAKALASLPGVTLGNQTASPHQSDLRIRGFTVSPVVGVPQSVSVFVDGVRVNEADASQVHLSLVPTAAVERVELVRGPVGAFGKNALAGALNIVTARGTGAGTFELDTEGGSWRSGAGTLRAGAGRGAFDALLVGSYRRTDGWRDAGYSQELSVFAKTGWRGPSTDVWLSYTFDSDSIEGPGPLPESWIEGGDLPQDISTPPVDPRRLQYTGGSGDALTSRMHFLNASVSRELADEWSGQLTSFTRRVDFRQGNDNITEPDALGLTDITSLGTTAQLTYRRDEHVVVIVGGEAIRNRVDIDIRELPNPAFPDVIPATTELLRTDEDNFAGFSEAWWRLSARFTAHGSLRYDYALLPIDDWLDIRDSGENIFREWSGGLGLAGEFGSGLGAFASYARGFRSPVILEVSCADPEDPCQLPFELGPDPPLSPVTSNTWQVGLRLARAHVRAELVGYWSDVRDDIFNVVDLDTPTRGFFTNLDRTRRIGSELSVEALPLAGLAVTATVALTRATFQSRAVLAAPFLDDDDAAPPGPDPGGQEQDLEPPEVEPGDRFPMVPGVTLSARARYRLGSTSLELSARRVGSQFLVGDEGNEAPFEKLAAYGVVDASAEHRFGAATAFVQVSNLLDSDYFLFGIISRNVRSPAEAVERFLTPGLPRNLRIGVRVQAGG